MTDALPQILLALVALVVVLVVGRRLWRGTAGPRADRLIQASQSVAVPAPLRDRSGAELRGLFVIEVGACAANRERLVETLRAEGDLRAVLERLVPRAVADWSSAPTTENPGALERFVAPELAARLREELARRGLELESMTGYRVAVTPELHRLENVWIARCTRGAPSGLRTSVNGLELYLDGLSGHGQVYASTAQRAGGMLSKSQSCDIVRNPELRVRYTVGKPSGLLHSDAFADIMSGAANP